MRYKLPDGVGAISVDGCQYDPDEDGFIMVPDDLTTAHEQLKSPHLYGLEALPDDPESGPVVSEADVLSDTRTRKAGARAFLEAYGKTVFGTASLPYLLNQVARVLEKELKADEPEADPVAEALAKPVQAVAPDKQADKTADKPADKAVDKTADKT